MSAARSRSPEELTPEALEERASRTILAGVRDLVRAAVARHGAASDYYDQTTSPLGRRRHNELARSGKIPATKLHGRWMIRKDDLREYIERNGIKGVRREQDEGVDDLIERVMRGDEGSKRR